MPRKLKTRRRSGIKKSKSRSVKRSVSRRASRRSRRGSRRASRKKSMCGGSDDYQSEYWTGSSRTRQAVNVASASATDSVDPFKDDFEWKECLQDCEVENLAPPGATCVEHCNNILYNIPIPIKPRNR